MATHAAQPLLPVDIGIALGYLRPLPPMAFEADLIADAVTFTPMAVRTIGLVRRRVNGCSIRAGAWMAFQASQLLDGNIRDGFKPTVPCAIPEAFALPRGVEAGGERLFLCKGTLLGFYFWSEQKAVGPYEKSRTDQEKQRPVPPHRVTLLLFEAPSTLIPTFFPVASLVLGR